MKLYTKTGDKGQTGLVGGTRVYKTDIRLEAYGTIDELNAHIGVLATDDIPESIVFFIRDIQHKLFTLGSSLATDISKIDYHPHSILDENAVPKIEAEIDRIQNEVPPFEHFVLPGGNRASSLCHVCRTLARRAERRIYEMNLQHPVDESVLVYVNRLSDYFFILSRYLAIVSGAEEFFWKR
jgi:cob(I)alamin adenosyltransferase